MPTENMLYRIRPRFVCFLLAIASILASAPGARAEEGDVPEIVLEIKENGVTNKEGRHAVALYDTIAVKVENLDKWAMQKDHDPSKFILYVDGNAFKGLPLGFIDSTTLQFDLRRVADNPENKAAWIAVLSRRPKTWTRTVPVTVGFDDGVQIKSSARAEMTLINRWWFWVFVFSFAAALGLFWWLAYASDIIRDAGPQPTGNDKTGKPNRKRFSLARTQMASWFFVVLIAYVFIWMVTSDLSNLTPSVLGLIGISAATGLAAAVVDSNKKGERDTLRETLEEKAKSDEVEIESLQSEIDTLTAAVAAKPVPANLLEQKAELTAKLGEIAAKRKEIEQAREKIREINAASGPPASKGFIKDVLSDDSGVSFHRFQIFAWTIVLVIIFIGSIYNVLAMPEFDTTLLALMGISGGTYIGFKLPAREG